MQTFLDQLLNGLSFAILIILSKFFWNYLRSPLKSFPGEWSTRFTNAWRFFDVWAEHPEITHINLHKQHGSAVRMGPNIVSLSDPGLIGKVFSTRSPWKKVCNPSARLVSDGADPM